MSPGHALHAINTITHLDAVEIYLHNALLAPHHFYEEREVCLQAFPYPRASRPKEDIFGRLLRDGARPVHSATLHVVGGGFLYGIEIKAVVFQEACVLTGHYSHGHVAGNLLQRHPLMMPSGRLACRNLLEATYEHQGRGVNGNKPIGHNSKDGGTEKEHHHPSNGLEGPFKQYHVIPAGQRWRR